jgi:segregation and condensation protein A
VSPSTPHQALAHSRFPPLSSQLAECRFSLPPFAGHPAGWTGSTEEFLDAIRTPDFPLDAAPLSVLVDQYVAHIAQLSPVEAAEYLHVAASLIHWKSRLLLPAPPALFGHQPDPRLAIVHELEASLKGRRKRTEATAQTLPSNEPVAESQLSLADLMVLLSEVEQAAQISAPWTVAASDITVAAQLEWLTRWFDEQSATAPVELEQLFAHHASVPAQASLFLALLEMSKSGMILLEQQESFGPVWIGKAQEKRPDQR